MTDLAVVLGRPRIRRARFTPLEKLQRRSTIDPDGCWTWDGSKNSSGYGQIGINGVLVLVHRLSYHLQVGPIPAGLQVDHRCHNDDRTCRRGTSCVHRSCWRPDHLEAVTGRENQRRSNAGSSGPLTFPARARKGKRGAA